MPFYELVDGQTVTKINVGLTQLYDAPEGESENKTWFLNQARFWSAESATAGPGAAELVEADTPTDLASVPRFMWGVVPSYGRHTMPALVHDRGCVVARENAATQRRQRREADELLRLNLASFAGMGVARRWLMWSAVRLFGMPAVAAFAVLTPLLAYAWVGYFVLGSDDEREPLPTPGLLLAGAAVACAVVLLVLVVSSGIEGFTDEKGNAGRRVRWDAVGSMFGAATIGLLAAGPLIPLVVVTCLTNTAIWILDTLLWLPGALLRLIENLTRVTTQGPGADATDGDRSTQRPQLRFFPGP